MLKHKLMELRLGNLVRREGKILAKKIHSQKVMTNRDKAKARTLLTNTKRKVLLRQMNAKEL